MRIKNDTDAAGVLEVVAAFASSKLVSGLLDSITVTQVVATIEAASGREVPPIDITIENFETLRAMFAYVAARIGSS